MTNWVQHEGSRGQTYWSLQMSHDIGDVEVFAQGPFYEWYICAVEPERILRGLELTRERAQAAAMHWVQMLIPEANPQ